eukprot:4817879-Pyramimonas_sp.AAC.1
MAQATAKKPSRASVTLATSTAEEKPPHSLWQTHPPKCSLRFSRRLDFSRPHSYWLSPYGSTSFLPPQSLCVASGPPGPSSSGPH